MFQLSKIATPRLLVAVLVVVLVSTVLILQIAGRGLIGTAITSFKTPAPVRDVAAAGAYAYVITEDHKLWVVDVSTPTAPAGVGVYAAPAPLTGVTVMGHYVYLAAGDGGLRVVDVATPTAPVEVGVWDTPEYVEGVTVMGHYVYLAAGDGGLRVVDVATPTAPVEVGEYDEPLGWLYATDVLVAGNHAYLTNRSGDMPIVDISDPSAPREVGSIPTGKALAVAGGYAFSIIGGGCGDPCAPSSLFVVDVSKPAMGSGVVGSYQWYSPQPFIDVAAADDYVYVAAGAGGLRVFDVSNPAAPVEVQSYDTPGSAERVVVAGDSIYIADGPGGLAILRRMPTRAARPTRVASETKAAVTTESTATPTYSYSGYALPPTTPLTVGETQLPPAWLIVGSEAIPASYGAVRASSGPVGTAPAQAPAEVSISVPAASEVVIGSPAVSAFQARVRDQSEEPAVLDLHGVVQRRGNLMSLMLDEIDPPMGAGNGGTWLLVVSVTFNDGYTVDYLWRLNAVRR